MGKKTFKAIITRDMYFEDSLEDVSFGQGKILSAGTAVRIQHSSDGRIARYEDGTGSYEAAVDLADYERDEAAAEDDRDTRI
jgi:hypothetical protein